MTLTERLGMHGEALDVLNDEPRPLTAAQEGSMEYHREAIQHLLQLMKDGWTEEMLS